jgi:glyoxylase-like metal-dependent hydrolase (beta-lactamase superfamily II)
MQQVDRGIFFEEAYLGVTLGALVFSHGAIMIDAPLRLEDARSWRSALLNQRGGSNRILVNLDAHPDRTLGAKAMDCTIIAHQKTAQVFRNRPTIFKGQNAPSGSTWESYSEAIGLRWAPPDITFAQHMNLHWGGPEIVLEHHPGPMAGSTWVIIPVEKVVFVGDTVAVNQTPFLANADLDEWSRSLELLSSNFGDYLIIAGRGGLAAKKVISAQLQLLKNVAKGIEKLVKRNAGPEATNELIPALMRDINVDRESEEIYTQRLRYGLYQYYARHYRPSSSLEQPVMEEDEQ